MIIGNRNVFVYFITNSKERARLFRSDYQERISKGTVAEVSRYLDNEKTDSGV
ncbi:hypothetical protein [Sulfurovum sp. NBC37-1]|uniref:hypothetical protein n=1 Tax=Sulfurovum sp. (strain NBC37-1) TaxID=387093 RepID=UPI0002DE5C8F|nr:hypothetical protein [Sulfurovum sp. NBC37-1]